MADDTGLLAAIGRLFAIVGSVLILVTIFEEITGRTIEQLQTNVELPVVTVDFTGDVAFIVYVVLAIVLFVLSIGGLDIDEPVILGLLIILFGYILGGLGGLLAIIGGILIVIDAIF